MLGGKHPMIQSGKRAKHFRMAHSIKYASREWLLLIFGYPDVIYKKGIRGTLATIMYK
jgi:hypothetical protein